MPERRGSSPARSAVSPSTGSVLAYLVLLPLLTPPTPAVDVNSVVYVDYLTRYTTMSGLHLWVEEQQKFFLTLELIYIVCMYMYMYVKACKL